MAPRWGCPDFAKSWNLFFIARAPSRFRPNPGTYTDANRQTKHLRTDLQPQTFENLKNVILGGTTICFSRREFLVVKQYFFKATIYNAKHGK